MCHEHTYRFKEISTVSEQVPNPATTPIFKTGKIKKYKNKIMCNCIKETAEKIISKMKEDNSGKATIGDGNFTHMGLSFTGNSGWRTYQEFEYEITPIKKDGSNGRQHKKRISMYHSYCPFCGEGKETD